MSANRSFIQRILRKLQEEFIINNLTMTLDQNELSILKGITASGGTGNILEFLIEAIDFDTAFELAITLQNKDLVKLLYSNFNKKLIVVELTLLGFAEGKK